MTAAGLVAATVVVPALGAGLVAVTGRWPDRREAVTLTTAAVLLIVVARIAELVSAGLAPSLLVAEPFPGLPVVLTAEPLGALFALLSAFLWVVTSVYSIGYMRGHGERNQTRFYAFFALSIAAAQGVAMAGNLVTLFLFYELLTLATYPLVTHYEDERARRAGRVYLGLLLTTSMGLLLLAIVWTWQLAGSVAFERGGILTDRASPALLGLLLAMYVFGIGKAAVMPVHRWLPAAMVAPTPVSALLHAVAVVKAGVFSILKVCVYVFGLPLVASLPASRWLALVAAATILIGSLVAMRQDNLKLRLAYSTVSQLSYMVVGALLANAWAVLGAALHIVMHAFGKITLFFCAGAIQVAAHRTEVSQLGGLGRRMPVTMAAFLLGALSIAGLPPLGGLWSKWYLARGAVEAGAWVVLAVLLVSSLLNLWYLVAIPVRACFAPAASDERDTDGIREAPWPSVVAPAVTALGSVVLFFTSVPLLRLINEMFRG